MKLKHLIINFVFMIVDAYFIIVGSFNFNSIFHRHIITIFIGHGDGYLGLFWLVCFVHDLIIFNLIILIVHFIKKQMDISQG